jgi:tetratricopeptide (TPR) repeat protein
VQAGDVVADRFLVLGLAGAGGMGSVWRAHDRLTGSLAALKVVHAPTPSAEERLEKEARVLAELSHPRIVRYVAHGELPDGALWLAMDWLEGEDLASFLRKGKTLSVAEALELAARVADALAAAHARGVVHRDIKPSNLFFVGGDPGSVVLLDFGLALTGGGPPPSSRTSFFVGTPGYLAPEQARGDAALDARADLFSLGCVLFECLAGRPAFVGDNPMALLARILLEDPAPLRELRPDVPPDVAAFCSRLLSKSPDERPADGAAALAEIRARGAALEAADARRSLRPPALGSSEQALLSVLVIGKSAGALAEARALLSPLGARVEPLADGSLLVLFTGRGAGGDQAARAARSALTLRAALGDVAMALATGRGDALARALVGEAIDRAVKLVRGAAPRDGASAGVALDDVTAGLLDASFDLGGDERGLVLHGEREMVAPTRTLLGRPTPFVGRERELETLVALFEECAAEKVARRVLVTAPAGAGKSRLRHELLNALDRRALVLMGRGDPVTAGGPLNLLGQALRHACSVRQGEPLVVKQRKILARVGRHLADTDERELVASFLGEAMGAPFANEGRPELTAARADPMLMADQVRRAWETFLGAESAAEPVVVVLEDLHYGDLATVRLVGGALTNLSDRPLFVVATGRPESRATFPDLWSTTPGADLRLGELPRRAGESLARAVLGEDAPAEVVQRVVSRAAGNPFYLEELCRAVAEGRDDRLPETVLAMIEARIEALPVETRRALRAASIFGRSFWESGLRALVGAEDPPERIRAELAELCRREIVTRKGAGKFAGDDEYHFRHGMVREAAYGMLTDEDRALGHRLAAAWLERVGETEAAVVAEHYEQGGEGARALGFWHRAAEQALQGNDMTAAITRADRALACGAAGDERGELLLLQAQAHLWRGESAAMEERAIEAMELLPRGSAAHSAAIAEAATAAFRLGRPDRAEALGQLLAARLDEGDTQRAVLTAASRVTFNLYLGGRDEAASAILRRLEKALDARHPIEPEVLAVIVRARARAALNEGSPVESVERYEAAARAFERAGDLRSACQARASAAYGRIELGAYEAAVTGFRGVLATAERMGLGYVRALAKLNLGNALARLGRLDEALAIEREVLGDVAARGDRRLLANAHLYLAWMIRLRGAFAEAEAEARSGLAALSGQAGMRAYGLAVLSDILLAQAKTDDALAAADEAARTHGALGSMDEGETRVRLSHAETLLAAGRHEDARAVLEQARARVLAKASRIPDADARERFVRDVAENARVLELSALHRSSAD